MSFLFAGFRMLEGRNMFKNSSLFCRGYARPQTRKSERLYSMESTLAWVAGNVAALKKIFFFSFLLLHRLCSWFTKLQGH